MADLASRISQPPTEGTSSNDQAEMHDDPLAGQGLVEPEFEVEVKLSDLQKDAGTPFYSARTFEDLKL
jgi:ATP-dependent RNA helicase DDX19/DBP5